MQIITLSRQQTRPHNNTSIANGRVVVSSSSLATVGRRSKLTGDANRGRKKLLSPEQSKLGKSSFHGRYSKVTHPMQRRSAVVRCADLPDPVETDGVDDHEAEPRIDFFSGILWFFAHQLIGVGNDVIMKYTGSTLGIAQVVFLRFAFATLTMLPVMLTSGSESFRTDRITLHIARSFMLAAGIALYCKGLSLAPIAVVTILNFTIPLFTLVLARMFLSERVDITRWAGTILGFVGVTIVVQPWGAFFNPMWLVVLLSASMFACLDVLNKVFVGKESFWAMIFYTALFTTMIAAYPAYLSWVQPTPLQIGLLAVLGAGANLLLYCLLKSFSLVDASALAPFRYTELLWSAAIGAILFSEIPARSTLLGAMVIIPSTMYVVWAESRRPNVERS